MQALQNVTVLQAELLLIAPLSRKRIFTRIGGFCPDYSPALLIKIVDLFCLLPFDNDRKGQ